MATRFIQNYIQELLNEHIPPGWSPPGGGNSGRPVGVAEPGRGGAPVDRLYRFTDRDRDVVDRLGPSRVQDKQHIRPGGRQPIRGMPSPMPGGGPRPGGRQPIGGMPSPMPSPMPGGGPRPGPSIEQEMLNRRRGQQRRVQGQQYPPPVQSGRTPVDSPPRTTSGGGPDPYDRILYGRGNDPSRDRRNMVDELRAQDERYKRRGKDPNVRELRRGGLEAGLSSAERNRPGAYGDPTRGGGALPSWYNEQYVAEAAGPEGRDLSKKVNKHFGEIRGFIGAISGGKANEFQDHVHDGVFSGHANNKIIDTHGPLKNHGMKANGDDYTADIHNYIDAVRDHHDYKTDVRDDSEKFYTGE